MLQILMTLGAAGLLPAMILIALESKLPAAVTVANIVGWGMIVAAVAMLLRKSSLMPERIERMWQGGKAKTQESIEAAKTRFVADLARAERILRSPDTGVIAHHFAIEDVLRAVEASNHDKRKGPLCSALIGSPRGMGSGYLTAKLAEALYGSADARIVINCGELTGGDAALNLHLGVPGGNEAGILIKALRADARKVIVIKGLDLLLEEAPRAAEFVGQLAERGTVTDRTNGQQVDATDATIIAVVEQNDAFEFLADVDRHEFDRKAANLLASKLKAGDMVERFHTATAMVPFNDDERDEFLARRLIEEAKVLGLDLHPEDIDFGPGAVGDHMVGKFDGRQITADGIATWVRKNGIPALKAARTSGAIGNTHIRVELDASEELVAIPAGAGVGGAAAIAATAAVASAAAVSALDSEDEDLLDEGEDNGDPGEAEEGTDTQARVQPDIDTSTFISDDVWGSEDQ